MWGFGGVAPKKNAVCHWANGVACARVRRAYECRVGVCRCRWRVRRFLFVLCPLLRPAAAPETCTRTHVFGGCSGRRAPPDPRSGVVGTPTETDARSIITYFSRNDIYADPPSFLVLQTSATLIYRRIWTFDGSLDSARRQNRGFYSSKRRRTRPGSPVGTQSPGLPVFSPSHYFLSWVVDPTAYKL